MTGFVIVAWRTLRQAELADDTIYDTLADATASARHRHPLPAATIVALDAPAVPPDDRWEWLDHLGDLADRLTLLNTVGDSDHARAVLEELGEGPWSEPLPEALARRDELSADIDRLVGETQ